MSQVQTHPKAVARHRIRIGPRSAGMLMTPEEFDATPSADFDDRYRYEIINGVLVVSPYPSISERDPNEELGYLLRTYRDTHPQGKALDVTVPEQTVPTINRRRADCVIWAGLGRIPNVETEIPTIVVEFVSSRKRDVLRDYEVKRDEYRAAGVKEYWVIDRFRQIMMVYHLGHEGPTCEIVTENESYQSPLLPGFVLPLARLFAKADVWSKPKRSRKLKEQTPPAGESHG